jgi:hypothetical protein
MDKPPGKGQREGAGHKVVITDPASAPALVGTGVAVLVAGPDAAAVGAAVAGFRAAGGEGAGWVGDRSDPAAREMAAELFPGYEVVTDPGDPTAATPSG